MTTRFAGAARAALMLHLALCLLVVVALSALVGRAELDLDDLDRAPTRLRAALAHESEEREHEARGLEPFSQPDLAEQFYVNQRTGPVRYRGPRPTVGVRPLDPSLYLPALAQMRTMPRYSTATGAVLPSVEASQGDVAAGAALGRWANLGPANQGGRTRALLIHPTTPSVMYAGGVAGGVWKSTDAGASWTTVTDLQMANLAVATLAFDPANANTIYAGTGEGVGNADAIRGAGIFRSTDAGATWTRLASTATSDFHYNNKIVVSPRDGQRLFTATRTGLWRSTDGGASWTRPIDATAVGGCTDMAIQTAGATGYLFVACGRTSSQGTVYRVVDDAVPSPVPESIMSLVGQGRASIAVAPSNEHTVYVLASQRNAGGGPGQYGLHGVYRSTVDGNPGSFTTQRAGNVAFVDTAAKINQLLLSNPVIALLTECGFGTSSFSNQGWYDNVIAVDPVNPDIVWAGGIDLWRSDDGGVTWGTAGYWWFTKGADPEYHHADQHAIVFHPGYDGASNRVMFSASDGGIDRVDNARAATNTTLAQLCGAPVAGGAAWNDRSSGYVTTQFYDGAAYPDGLTYFGGLQDNGTLRGTTASGQWSALAGGDGGYVAVDTLGDAVPSNDVLFLENTGKSLQRSTNGGATFSSVTSTITGSGFLFIAPFAMNQGNRQQLWTGGFDIWRTTNQATSWDRATGSSGTCGVGAISAIATHPLDGNRVLVGMSDGCYHYSHAALSAPNTGTWPGGGTIATGNISWMAWDPTNLNVAYATVSNFTTTTVLKTIDGGMTWAPSMGAGATALPQVPALTVIVNPDDPQQVYVGTDLGVFTSIDGGASWYLENTGFANVPVESLQFSQSTPRYLYAFTHGRGAWRVSAAGGPTAPISTDDAFTVTGASLTVVAPGVLANDNANGGGAMTAVVDAPPSSGTLTLGGSGGFTYTPAPGFSGAVTFTYRASNTSGFGNLATVTLTVSGPPSAVADAYSTAFATPLAVVAPGVLANDNANGGGAMTAVLDTPISSGSLSLAADGSFSFTPATDFVGTATFTYHAVTTVGAGAPATVSITVNAPTTPQPPRNMRVRALSGGTVTFTWTAPPFRPAPTGYVLEGGLSPGAVIGALPLGATPAVSITLSPGVFYVRVRTTAGGAVSAPSNEVVAHLGVPAAPSAPANLLGLANGSTLVLAWTPTFDGGEPTGAVLDVAGPVAGALPLGAVDAFSYAGVPPGTYTFSVRQTTAAGTSAPSNSVTLTFPGGCASAPAQPAGFLAYQSGGVLSLLWDPPASGAAPTSYVLNVTGAFVGAVPFTTRAFSTPVPPGTYNFTVAAVNPCGTGAATPVQSVVVP